MSAIGGSIKEVTLFGRVFAVAADADASRSIGGYSNELQFNGDGSARKIMTMNGWKLTGLTLEIDDSRGDEEFLQEIADTPDFVPISITFASDVTYQGTGTITDDKEVSSQNATGSISLGGPGKLTKQS